MGMSKPVTHLIWCQGRPAIDDVVDYYEVATHGSKSVDGSDPFPVYDAATLAAKDAEIAKLREALAECEDYFENRSDADCDETGFIPNEEMKMMTMVQAALKGGEA
jgi:hypothetical protein